MLPAAAGEPAAAVVNSSPVPGPRRGMHVQVLRRHTPADARRTGRQAERAARGHQGKQAPSQHSADGRRPRAALTPPLSGQVFVGHEYSLRNLEFALTAGATQSAAPHSCQATLLRQSVRADKGNQAVVDKLSWARQEREAGRPTVPSTIKACSASGSMRCTRHSSARRWPASAHTLMEASRSSVGPVAMVCISQILMRAVPPGLPRALTAGG